MQHVRFRAVLYLLLTFIYGLAQASTGDPLAANRFFTSHTSANGVELEFDVPPLSWQTEGADGMIPILENAGQAGVPGAPMLPVYSRMVPVPAGMDLVLDAVDADWEQAGSYHVAFDRGEMGENLKDEELYSHVADESWTAVEVGETGRWRDIRFAPVVIRPLRMDAVSGEVEVATRMSIGFRYVPSANDDDYDPPGVSEAMLPLYEQLVPGSLDNLDPNSIRRGTYLLIVPSDWMEQIQPLVKWRTRMGFHVEVVDRDVVGEGANDIWSWINNYYLSSDPPLDYVVFIGDVDQVAHIPTFIIDPGVPFPIDPNIATDHKYTYNMNSGNSYANVLPRYFVGRISVDSWTEVSVVVNKILAYENNPNITEPSRWTRALTIADATFAHSTQQTQDWVRDKLLDNGFTNVDQIVRTLQDEPSASDVLSSINNNVSWVAYRGFGSHTGWSGPHVSNEQVISMMSNVYKTPVVTSMVCGGGAFDEPDDDPCFGEVWLRLGDISAPKGAVAFIAPSEIDTHTRWNNMIIAGWYTALFDQGLRTTGQCLISAKMQLYDNYPTLWNPNGSNENSVWFYFHTYNILGDPALQLRAETPRDFNVSYPAELASNATYVPVTVRDNASLPVPDAYVVVTEDETTILGSVRTNSAGIANVQLEEQPSGGNIELTVTRPEYIPLMVNLSNSGNVGLQLLASDGVEQSSDPQTNGDGILNPGELIQPMASFQVAESGGLDNVQITVSLPDGGGSVQVANEQFGDLSNGATIDLTAPRIRLSSELENGTVVPLIFTVQSNTRQQTHIAYLDAVQAPIIEVEDISFSTDWGPGDTADLTITLGNQHPTIGAGQVTAVLELDDNRVEVDDGNGSWSNLAAASTGVDNTNDRFTLSVDESAYPGRQVEATLILTTAEGLVQRRTLTLEVEGSGPTTPTGPVGPGYYMYEDVDAGYDYIPSYPFETIVGQPGSINLGLNDVGDNMDVTTTVTLPFSFPYWDDFYDEISVCSNGWLAFGETDQFFFRNRPIPGPLSPNGGLCAFWDDLQNNWGNAGIYVQYDSENGWYTIEWYDVHPTTSFVGHMSFQIRLFDPDVHGAPGGLGMFAFIYDDVLNSDAGENYATVGIISPDGTEAMQVEFADMAAPTTSGVVDDRQMLFAARTSEPLLPPDLHILTPQIQVNARAGEERATHLRIENRGGRSARVHIAAEGISNDWGIGGEVDESGGPDASGYRFYDSNEYYGPSYSWIDIEEAGNEVTLSGGGSEATAAISGEQNLPFDFYFYGIHYSSFWVCEAGYVTFVDPGSDGSPTNTELPRSFAPRASIFPFWDNIAVGTNGHVYVTIDDDRAVITWKDLGHLAGDDEAGPYTFQVVLNADGAIHAQYADMNPRLNSATIGVQNELGNIGLLVAANANVEQYMEEELALRFTPGIPWLTVAPIEAGVTGNGVTSIELTASAQGGIAPGLHSGRLLVTSALTEEAFTIPIEFFISTVAIGSAPNIRVETFPGEEIEEGGNFADFDLDPYVEDWDNNPSVLKWTAYNHDGLQIDIDEDNVVSVSALDGWSGDSEAIFRVRDNQYNYDEVRVRLRVGDGNNAPRFTEASPASVGRILPDTEVNFSVSASDPEGENVTYTWYHGVNEIGTGTTASVNFEWLGADTVRVVAVDESGVSTTLYWSALISTTDTDEDAEQLPSKYALEALYPNPFNATVRMRYALPTTAQVDVRIYNLLGREVAHRALGRVAAGRHELSFNASQWASGLYFVRWQAGEVTQVRKAVLMK